MNWRRISLAVMRGPSRRSGVAPDNTLDDEKREIYAIPRIREDRQHVGATMRPRAEQDRAERA